MDRNTKELNAMRKTIDERERQENELKQRARVSTDEVEELKEMVGRVSGECKALKEERFVHGISVENREDLRLFFANMKRIFNNIDRNSSII